MRTLGRQHRIALNGNSLSRQALAFVLCAVLAQATFSAGQSYPAPENAGAVIGIKPGATVDNQPLEKAGPLSRNAVLRTNRTGRVRIRLRGGEVLSLGGGTELQVSRANPDAETAAVRVQAGQVRSEVGRFHKNEGSYDMTTPQAQITSRGNSDFYLDVASGPFYGYNRPGAKVSQGVIHNWWRQGMIGSAKAHYEGIKAFSETDQNEDLKAISVPTLVLHGEDDQVVPIDDAGRLSVKLVQNGKLKTYPGYPHGMLTVHADVLNPDLLAFVKS